MQGLETTLNQPQDRRRRSCFPCNLSRCCPCLPTSWTKVQDWLHLVLITGVLGSLFCLLQMIYELGFGSDCRSPLCFKQWIAGVIVLPTTIYFIQTIGNYDEQLKEKKQRHKEEVNKLISEYNETVADLQRTCQNLTETANGFAATCFNQQSSSFKDFLKQIKDIAQYYVEPELLTELRRFIQQWFETFSGTLINPRSSPLLEDWDVKLMRCTSVQALCDTALKMLESFKVDRPRFEQTGSIEDGGMVAQSPQQAHQGFGGRCRMSWVTCGRFGCCRRERSDSVNGMPVTFLFGCVKLRVLSRSHANLLFAFLADILLIVFEAYTDRWPSFILVILNEACVVSMLACFDHINEIAQLERQIHVIEQRKEDVRQRRDEATESWSKVEQLHDLWKYRTLPSLMIMGKVHKELHALDVQRMSALHSGNDQVEDQRVNFLRRANDCLEVTQRQLGDLQDWRGQQPRKEWKDTFGQELLGWEHASLNDVLSTMEDPRMLRLPPPTATPGASPGATGSGPPRA